MAEFQGLCRDCLNLSAEATAAAATEQERCSVCQSPRVVRHTELGTLGIAHIDCDAFYASVEKRDRPELRDRPVIVGGGRRGVVSAACYLARIHGVHSAMPMFKALKACPEATVIRPDMTKYSAEGRRIREMMRALTPLVEPLSIDEAFLDLNGTEALHGGPPAQSLASLALKIEREVGITVSIGLSYNKSLAKVASDLDKPRGFALIGEAEALDFLAPRPVSTIWGVGKSLQRALSRDGIETIGTLRAYDEATLVSRYGRIGQRLYNFARGKDLRRIEPNSAAKSVSSETTFESDIVDFDSLKARLWPLCEAVARRLKRAELAGQSVTLKLKTKDFRLITRSRKLDGPTRLAETLYRAALPLLEREADGRAYRLIGIGTSDLGDDEQADRPDLLDPDRSRRARVEEAIDSVRERLGNEAIFKGRSLRGARRDKRDGQDSPEDPKSAGSAVRRR